MSEAIPKKQLGQHWLHDKSVLQSICDVAELVPADTVLEIGPGTGELTEYLVNTDAKVVALEFDDQLIPALKKRFNKNYIQIIQGDIRSFDLGTLPEQYKIVANIPYYLSTYLFRMLCDTAAKPDKAVLLVQKEVALRAAASPGEMALVSVLLQLYYDVSLGMVVPPELFTPPPKVDSQILILNQREAPLFEVDSKKFTRLLKAGFSERRKKLRSSLSAGLHISKVEAETLCKKADVDPNLRAQNLSLQQWHKLYLSVELL